MTVAQFVPRDEEVLTHLGVYRKTLDPTQKAPNAKQILKALTNANPQWKLTQQRMVKILKREHKPVVAFKENTAASANIDNLFSPKTASKAQAVDTPVNTKNILKSRLRPSKALSFVYGKAKGTKTPTKQSREADDDDEAADPSFVPNFDQNGNAATPEAWSRVARPSPSPPTPPAAAFTRPSALFVIENPTPMSLPNDNIPAPIIQEFANSSPSPVISRTPANTPAPVDSLVSNLLDQDSLAEAVQTPDEDTVYDEQPKSLKSDDGCFAGIQCSVM